MPQNLTYLLLDLFVAAGPLIGSLAMRKKDIRFDYRAFLLALISVGAVFIIWDNIFTYLGVWSFNPNYLLGIDILAIPLEELLFFIAIPFASIALFILLNAWIPERTLSPSPKLFAFLGIISAIAAVIAARTYTTTILGAIAGLLFYLGAVYPKHLVKSRNFYLFLLVMIIPFLAVNYLLTSLPVVSYDNTENLGLRILTIPIEDLFYSVLMLTLYLDVYLRTRKQVP